MSHAAAAEGPGAEPTLVEVADGAWAYVQPDGSWGWSNAGLIRSGDASLLVDTLFDLHLTRRLLERLAPLTASAPIGTLVNTHANGDHCHGNQLVGAPRILATTAAAREMAELPPSLLHALKEADLGPDADRFVTEAFGPFRFDDIEPVGPTETFSDHLTVTVGERTVELIEVGPAHTRGDLVVHVPDLGVIYTGDIVFWGSTPIVWAGPPRRWIAACERLRDLGPTAVVPGHGPVTDVAALEVQADYFRWLLAECALRHAAGLGVVDAAWDLDLGAYADWSDRERIVVNVDAAYAELDPSHERLDIFTALGEMGRYRAHR